MEHDPSIPVTPDLNDLRVYVSILEDPRIDRRKLHSLVDVVMIIFLGIMCGAQGWDDIEFYAENHAEWLKTFLTLKNGIPSADTYRRVFARLDPHAVQECLLAWINAIRVKMGGEVIAIDGKTIRGSSDGQHGIKALHSVTAWATESRLVLGQVKTAEKSNEIVAIPELLDLVDVSGSIVTIDAMGCQMKIAQRIIEKKGDYILALKGNQPDLEENVKGFFETELEHGFREARYDYHKSVDKGHGRIETRECYHTDDIGWLSDRSKWKNLASIAMIVSTREVGGKVSRESRYFISSLPLGAAKLASAVRSHWEIENTLHHTLDVTFNEDRIKIRKDRAPENIAIVRRVVLSILKRDTNYADKSMRRKSMYAAAQQDYLKHLLLGSAYTAPQKPSRKAPPKI